MKPINPGPANGNPYFCGNPGGLTSITATSPSSWDVKPPAIDFNWVAKGGKDCTSISDCGDNEICGNCLNAGHSNLIKMVCGE